MPSAIAGAFVLTVYADTGALLYELPRPLVGAIVAAGVLQATCIAITRSAHRGTMSAAAMVVALIDLKIALAVAILVWWVLLARRIRWHFLPSREQLSSALRVFVILLLIMSALRVMTGEAFDLDDLAERSNGSGAAVPTDSDIFLLMLDGYPRSDTLLENGYDNAWFETELAQRGFATSDQSTSNYPYTGLVLASMFNAAHLVDIQSLNPAPESHVGQTRALIDAINHGWALRVVEERGYWTASAGLTEVRGSIRAVDQVLDAGEIRLWERQVLQRTSIWPLLCEAVVIPQHRSLIESTFKAVEATASADRNEPTFMFAHVMSPHTPIVFDENGDPATVRASGGCGAQFHIDATEIGLTPSAYWAAMAEQVHYLNTLTLDAIDAVIEASPEAVIVIFSDHGARYSQAPTREWFHTFFAARTPGQAALYGDEARPVDIFPKLFEAYFGINSTPVDDRRFTSTHGIFMPLIIEPWPSVKASTAPGEQHSGDRAHEDAQVLP